MTDPLFEQADALMRRHQTATSSVDEADNEPPTERHDIELDLDAILDSDPEPEATAAAAHSSADAVTHIAKATDDAADDWPVLSDMVDAVDLSPSSLQALSLDASLVAADEIPLLTEVAAVTDSRQAEHTVATLETTAPDTRKEPQEVALTLDHAALQQLIAEEVQAALTSQLAPLIEQLSATLTERLTTELQQRLGQSLQQR